MDCTIVRLEAGTGVQLLGLAVSDAPARIHYVLTVAQSGNAGASMISEIGDVDVPPHIPTEFGHTRLPLRDTQLDAHLIVTWEEGKIECDLVQAPDDV
ncbi:curli-like amyloid fiber formation chaperone CsgH [Devosia sp. ZB163]|uniref:curli-like amyloid fiber formation chaperone CsgH n=1 Tax=Devosia sp. ZB163 TaxID=3025938 RepID=UPI002362D159|nr:curli-like amyloid fiber formation chaperone CsgH [Devosia sp. ZB163]MDC9823449.1 curli-like amyloid fiber formation chaperone CsgH [Devosia sp. ZB163]